MIRLLLLPAILLTLALTLPIALVRALPADDHTLHEFLTPAEDCAALCLLGIRPGVTTVGEALEQLRAHDWVAKAELNATGRGYGDIKWQWSGRQPGMIDDSRPGRVTFYWEEHETSDSRQLVDMPVELLSIHTRIRMYQAQTWLGQPDTGFADYTPGDDLGYSAAYNNAYGMVELSTVMPCPANLLNFWNARAKITLSKWRGSGQYVPPQDIIRWC